MDIREGPCLEFCKTSLGLPVDGYMIREPAEKAFVELTCSDILEPRLIKIQARREAVYQFKEDGNMDMNNLAEVETYHLVCALRYIKKITLVSEGLSRAAQAGYLAAIDVGLLRSTVAGLSMVLKQPLKYSEIPKMLTGVTQEAIPVTNKSLEMLASAILAIDNFTGQSKPMSDSIVFADIFPNASVKSRLKNMDQTQETKALYLSEIQLATIMEAPDASIRALQLQQRCCCFK